MRTERVVNAPRRGGVDSPDLAHGEPTPERTQHRDATAGIYHLALGRRALQHVRLTLAWCADALRLPSDRGRQDASRHPDAH
jgi:hypothetical protein